MMEIREKSAAVESYPSCTPEKKCDSRIISSHNNRRADYIYKTPPKLLSPIFYDTLSSLPSDRSLMIADPTLASKSLSLTDYVCIDSDYSVSDARVNRSEDLVYETPNSIGRFLRDRPNLQQTDSKIDALKEESFHLVVDTILWIGTVLDKFPFHSVGSSKPRLVRIKRGSHSRGSDDSRVIRVKTKGNDESERSDVEKIAELPLCLEFTDPSGKGKASKDLSLEEVYDIQTGCKTTAFHSYIIRNGKHSVPNQSHCFSIICRNRTMDLQAQTNDQANKWVRAFHDLMAQIQSSFASQSTLTSPLADNQTLQTSRYVREEEIDEDEVFSAVRSGDVEKFQWYLENGFHVNHMESKGFRDTPLIAACRFGHCDIIQIALQYDAKNDPHPSFGQTALQVAVSAGHEDCVRLLLETAAVSGSDVVVVNHEDSSKEAPIHVASRCGSLTILKLLVQHGANWSVVDSRGNTCLHGAVQSGHVTCVRYILDVSGDLLLEERNDDGLTSLHIAVLMNRLECLRILIECGADIRACTVEGLDVYGIAKKRKLQKVIGELEKYMHKKKGGQQILNSSLPHQQPSSQQEECGDNLFAGLNIYKLNHGTCALPNQHAWYINDELQSGMNSTVTGYHNKLESLSYNNNSSGSLYHQQQHNFTRTNYGSYETFNHLHISHPVETFYLGGILWHTYFDKSGFLYYLRVKDSYSQWEDPRSNIEHANNGNMILSSNLSVNKTTNVEIQDCTIRPADTTLLETTLGDEISSTAELKEEVVGLHSLNVSDVTLPCKALLEVKKSNEPHQSGYHSKGASFSRKELASAIALAASKKRLNKSDRIAVVTTQQHEHADRPNVKQETIRSDDKSIEAKETQESTGTKLTTTPLKCTSQHGYDANENSTNRVIETNDLSDPVIKKYMKMTDMGVPPDAVVQKMISDRVDNKLIDKIKNLLPTAPSDENKIFTLEDGCKSAINADNQSADYALSKYMKMVQVGVPPAAVLRKMQQENVLEGDLSQFKNKFGLGTNPNRQDSSSDDTVRLKSDSQYVDQVLSKYMKMVQVGVPPCAVIRKMQQDNIPKEKMSEFEAKFGLERITKGEETPSKISIKRASQKLSSARSDFTSPIHTIQMQKIHWKPVSESKLINSLWALDDEVKRGDDIDHVEIKQLESLFATKHIGDKKKNTYEKPDKKGKRKDIHLLDLKRANNVAIALAQFRDFKNYEELCNAVVAQDRSKLTTEKILNMKNLLPTTDEMATMRQYNGGVEGLGRAELFFHAVTKVPRFAQKLDTYLFILQFSDQINELETASKSLDNACDEVVQNKKLTNMLRRLLAVGNAMNERAGTPKAAGITVDSLLKTATKKGIDGKTSVLDHVIGTLLKQGDNVDSHQISFWDEMSNVQNASRIEVTDLKNSIRDIKAGVERIRSFVRSEESESNQSSNVAATTLFLKRSHEFIELAGDKLISFEAMTTKLEESISRLCRFFAEETNSSHVKTIFSTLTDFAKLVDQSIEKLIRQEKAERRRALLNTPIKTRRDSVRPNTPAKSARIENIVTTDRPIMNPHNENCTEQSF